MSSFIISAMSSAGFVSENQVKKLTGSSSGRFLLSLSSGGGRSVRS